MRIRDWSSDVCSSDLQKTDIDLGQSYDRFRIIDKNAVMRRHCQFEPAAECKTIDNRNPGLPTLLYCAMHLGRALDRKSVVSGKSVSVRVDLAGRRLIKTKTPHPTPPPHHPPPP